MRDGHITKFRVSTDSKGNNLIQEPIRATWIRSAREANEDCRFKALSFDQDRPVITIELNGGLIYSVTNIFSTDIHVI